MAKRAVVVDDSSYIQKQLVKILEKKAATLFGGCLEAFCESIKTDQRQAETYGNSPCA